MRAIERLLGLVTLCAAGSLAQAQRVQPQPLLHVDGASMAKCPDGLSWATAYTTLEEALYWAGPAAGRFICVRGNCQGCDSMLDNPSVVETRLIPDQVFFVPGFRDADEIETPPPYLYPGDDPFPPCDPALTYSVFPSSIMADGGGVYLDRPAALLAGCDWPENAADNAAIAALSPDRWHITADINRDGLVDFFDIDPFLECLFATCP
jgi:hypothetical protein